MNLTTTLSYLSPVYTHQPVTFIVGRFLKMDGITIDTDLLHQKLIQHPYFPSLLSISDVLKGIGIPNHAYKIDLETLKENFESQVLTYLKIDRGLFCILSMIKDGIFKIITEKGEMKWLTEEEFKTLWEGLVLDIEVTNQVEKSVHGTSYPPLKYILVVCGALITFYLLQTHLWNFSSGHGLILTLNFFGVLVSWILVLQHFNKNNLLVQQLCESKTQEGCGTVLSSKTAQLTPWLSMAEAGLVYFAGMTLVILFYNRYSPVYLLSILAPIFSIYAIYLQAFIIKQWCRLCMAVHAIVFLSFAASAYFYWRTPITLLYVGEVSIFLLPGLLWFLFKPYIKQLKDAKLYQSEYARLKYNPEVFLALITKQPRINIPQSLKVFTLGNSEAEHELTFVSNPFCGPCAIAHLVIQEWIKQDLEFKINIIFIHSVDKNDKKRVFTGHISGIQTQNKLEEALHKWYTEPNKDMQKWADKYKLKPSQLPYNDQDMQNWLERADVHSTPMFFLNGYRLPKTYRIADVRYLINELPLHNRDTGFPILQTNLYDL